MPAAVVNGVRLHYEERGRGPGVVLVHGGMSDYTEWSALLERLSSSHRVVAYSRRNAYPNAIRSDVPAGVPEHVADLAGLLEALDMVPVSVVGESYGAVVALEWARRHPHLARTLVIDEPPLPSLLTSPEDAPLRASLEATLAAALASRDPGWVAQTVVDFIVGAPGSFAHLPSQVRESLLRDVPAFRIEFSAGLPGVTPEEVTARLPPTLWLTSATGTRALARITEILASAAGSRALEIPGTTHASILGAPGYLEAVEAFLRERS